MTKFLIVALFFIGTFSYAKNICFPGDEGKAIRFAGGPAGIKNIDYDFDVISLVEQGIKAQEKSEGTKTFINIYDGLGTHYKTICVRISGQAYMENSCQVCIEKY